MNKPVLVSWSLSADAGEPAHTEAARDISSGGLCLLMSEPLAIGQELQVEFSLPPAGLIRARCVVRRVLPWHGAEREQGKLFNVGVAFVDLPDAHRAVIEQLIISSYFV